MKYTSLYIKEITEQTKSFIEKAKEFKSFEIEVEGGFSLPPVIEICRVFDEGMSFEDQEKLTRYCIHNKPVKIFYEDKEIGGFIMNKLDDRFDIFPVFVEYPMALTILIETCVAFVTKKFTPPSHNIQKMEEAKIPGLK